MRLVLRWLGSLAFSLLASTALTQLRLSRDIEPTLPSTVLTDMPEVRTDLRLTEFQEARIEALKTAARRRDDELFKGIDRHNTDHAEAPPFSTSREVWRRVEADVVVLLLPDQRRRLRAIQYQSVGFKALYLDDLQRFLRLSSEQVDKVRLFRIAQAARTTDILQDLLPRFTKAQLATAVENIRVEGEKVTAILSPEQAADYRERLGKPVKSVKDFVSMRG